MRHAWAGTRVCVQGDEVAFKHPIGIPRGAVYPILTAKLGGPVPHFAASCCSRRAAHLLLSAGGADERNVDYRGRCAREVVGVFVDAGPEKAARKADLGRMLERGPAFRARSWAWPTPTEAAAVGKAGEATGGVPVPVGGSALALQVLRWKDRGLLVRAFGSALGHEWRRMSCFF
ncbi:unnamed protein product, partial [Scytosiphon promiscuus]